MKQKQERLLWVSLVGLLSLVLLTVSFAPSLSALAQRDEKGEAELTPAIVEKIYRTVQARYVDNVPPESLLRGAVDGLLGSLEDPYSLYADEAIAESLSDITSGEFGGVGLIIGPGRLPDGAHPGKSLTYVRVVSPLEGSPAHKVGVLTGDYIYAIDGQSAVGFTVREVSNLLRGPPGEAVTVTLLRRKRIKIEVDIVRSSIEHPTVQGTRLGDDVGYLRIIRFTPFTAERVTSVLQDLLSPDLRVLLLDLRKNIGGLLSSAIDVSNLFLGKGEIVSIRYRNPAENRSFSAAPERVVIPDDLRILILTDENTASAAEILTGALRDNGRATTIGKTTFGKGAVQQVFSPAKGIIFKLTVARYFTPSGRSIDKKGIAPDIAVTSPSLTPLEEENYISILEQNLIPLFVDNHPRVTEEEIDSFLKELIEKNLLPTEWHVRSLVRDEMRRRMNPPPLVDVEYDEVLKKALEIAGAS